MKRLVLFVFLLMLAPICAGQTPTVSFETVDSGTGFPANWTGSGVVIDATISRQPGTHAAKLAGTNAMLQTLAKDVGSLEFYIRAPQSTDDYTVVVETSIDTSKWTPQMTIEQKLSAANPGSNPPDRFDAQVKQLNMVGNFYIRWRVSRYSTGALILDDVKLEAITAEAREKVLREQQEAVIRDLIDKRANDIVATANFATAKKTFEEIEDVYQKQAIVLANIGDKTRSVTILAGTAQATAIRNQMANPMNYQAFQEIAGNLNKVLPPTKKSRLSDIISGVTRVAGVASTLFTGFNLTGVVSFVDNFKNLLADGYSKQNLDAQKKEGVISDTERKDLITNGVTKYELARNFLDIIINENVRVVTVNEELAVSARDANALQKDLENNLGAYLKYIGADSSQENISKIIAKDANAIQDFKSRTKTFLTSKLGDPTTQPVPFTLSPEQRFVLREMESKFRKIDELKGRYEALTAGMLKFYQDFQQDLNRPNPFTGIGGTTATRWDEQKQQVITIISPIPDSFKKTYVNVNLYQP